MCVPKHVKPSLTNGSVVFPWASRSIYILLLSFIGIRTFIIYCSILRASYVFLLICWTSLSRNSRKENNFTQTTSTAVDQDALFIKMLSQVQILLSERRLLLSWAKAGNLSSRCSLKFFGSNKLFCACGLLRFCSTACESAEREHVWLLERSHS
jgi:hypothetical protein